MRNRVDECENPLRILTHHLVLHDQFRTKPNSLGLTETLGNDVLNQPDEGMGGGREGERQREERTLLRRI